MRPFRGLWLIRTIHECASLHTPIPASASLFITEQENSSPRAGKYPRAVAAPHLPLAARRVALPEPPGRQAPLRGEDPGSVGAPPCLTAARSACAGSFPLGRRAGAAPALAAVPLAGLPARGKLVRQMPARAVPEALRAERSASAERGGWPDLCAECGPDRLWSAGCGPARADRLCRSGYRPARCSSRTERMAAAAREESPPSRAARRTSRAAARSRTSGPVADQRAGRGPRD